ncbi:MAG: DUF5721 family protein [Lachnospiraceae bacterium]|nr:DUF5721 family protein [Lachnospiraceae bacterium]
MLFFTIEDVKGLMAALLQRDSFDSFLLVEAEIRGRAALSIDGHLPEDFYSDEEISKFRMEGDFSPYREIRPLIFEGIRGKHTPKQIKIVFKAPNSLMQEILADTEADPDQVSGFFLNLRFSNGKLTLSSGCSMKTFSLDKTAEKLWDAWLSAWMDREKFYYTIMA